jgi:hypothetical protein
VWDRIDVGAGDDVGAGAGMGFGSRFGLLLMFVWVYDLNWFCSLGGSAILFSSSYFYCF